MKFISNVCLRGIKEAVIISKLGVPRFAVKNILEILQRKSSDLAIKAANLERLKKAVKEIRAEAYRDENTSGTVIKEIVLGQLK